MRLFLACVVLSVAAQAATTINTTLNVSNAAASFTSSGGINANGPVSLSNIGSGTFVATLAIQGQNLTGPFTITLSGTPTVGSAGDTITGTITASVSLIAGAGTGSATVSGGTGAFANATGTFSNGSGSGTATGGTGATFGFTASGSITIGGSGGGTPPPAAPTITGVLNNYSFTPSGFPNSGIAQGALFIVQGTGMADPSAKAVLQSSASPGLPVTLNGASAKVTVNGTTTVPAFYYAIATQLALVLPSNTPTGPGQITVTYNNQSASFPIQVVASAMGFDTYYGVGTGLGVATDNASGALYSYTNSVPPGTTVTLWGSGLGADPARDTTFAQAAFSINNLAHVYIGGIDAPIAYQGASGYPGVNQVDVTIPTNVQTGCNVSVVGVTGAGVPTNFVTLAIGNGVCSDTIFGVTGTDYSTLTGQTTVKSGFVALAHTVSPAQGSDLAHASGTQTNDVALAEFDSETGSAYASGGGTVSIPGCIVDETGGSGGGNITSVGLDAGTITVAGPNGNATLQAIPQIKGIYNAQLAAGFIPTSGGTFNFQGTGGADVGSFKTSVVFPNPLLTWTNDTADATVTRSSGVLITWTGGSANTFVIMNGDSSGTVNGQSVSGSFTCIAPQSALQFQVPSYVTGALPAGTGSLSVSNYTSYQTFSAAGIDRGIAAGFSSEMINATYQ